MQRLPRSEHRGGSRYVHPPPPPPPSPPPSPISKVPYEVLREIFHRARPQYDDITAARETRMRSSPWSLYGVCKTWKELVGYDPKLWDSVQVCIPLHPDITYADPDSPQAKRDGCLVTERLLKVYLERGRGGPYNLRLIVDPRLQFEQKAVADALKAFASSRRNQIPLPLCRNIHSLFFTSNRWRELGIKAHHSFIRLFEFKRVFIRDSKDPKYRAFPSLETLILDAQVAPPEPRPEEIANPNIINIFEEHAPRLHNVELCDTPLWFITPFSNRLRKYSTGFDDYYQLHERLIDGARLVVANVYLNYGTTDYLNSNLQYNLPNLHQLTITTKTMKYLKWFVHALVTPRLLALRIHYLKPSEKNIFVDIQQLIQGSGCRLIEFEVRGWLQIDRRILPLLQSLVHLRTLRLLAPCEDSVVASLQWDPDLRQDTVPILPRLSRLTLSQMHLGVIYHMVLSRAPRTLGLRRGEQLGRRAWSPLDCVWIVTPSQSDESPWAHIRQYGVQVVCRHP